MIDSNSPRRIDRSHGRLSVRDFLRTVPSAGELVSICRGGWAVCTVHVDAEDLFRIPADIASGTVSSSCLGTIRVTDPGSGRVVEVPARIVDYRP